MLSFLILIFLPCLWLWSAVYRLGHREQKDEWAPRRVDVFQRQNLLPPDAVISAGSVNSACTAGTQLMCYQGSLSLVLALVAISLFTHLIRIPFLCSLINSYIFMRRFFMSIFGHMFACIIGFLYYSWFSNSLSCLSNKFFLFGRSGKLISIKHRLYALHSHIWKVMAPYRMSNTKTHL